MNVTEKETLPISKETTDKIYEQYTQNNTAMDRNRFWQAVNHLRADYQKKTFENKEIQCSILEQTKELEGLLNERIAELYDLRGAMEGQFLQGARHTFCYYRDFVWKISNLAKKLK